MGEYERERARARRKALRLELGNICMVCGAERNLTFDCMRPVRDGGRHHRFEPSRRASFYARQHANGNVLLLCHSCNGSKGRLDLFWWLKHKKLWTIRETSPFYALLPRLPDAVPRGWRLGKPLPENS